MDTFIFAANAVAPVVLMTALGYILRHIGLCSREFAAQANKLCYRVFLPVMLFINIYNGGGLRREDLPIAGFAVGAVLVMFLLGLLTVTLFIRDPKQKGTALQCMFRSNYAIIGLPLATSLAGEEGARLSAVVSVAAIPLFNILAVVALTMYRRDEKSGKRAGLGAVLRGIVTNPLIIGVFCGMIYTTAEGFLNDAGIAFRLADITPVYSVLKSLAGVTTPLALIALGARFEFSAVRGLLGPIAVGTVGRLVVSPLVVLAVAMIFFPQYGAAEYALLVALTASPVAVSSAVLTAEMDGDSELAGQYVVWTTVLSMLTVFLIVAGLRALGVF